MSQITFSGFNPAEAIQAAASNNLIDPGPLNQEMRCKMYPLTADITPHRDRQRGIQHVIRRVGNMQLQIIANNTNYLRAALQRDAEQICWHCLVSSNLWPEDYEPWAVVVAQDYSPEEDKIICYGIGYCCSAECAYAQAKIRTAVGDKFWQNAERLTYDLIRRVYPNKAEIKAAPDYILRNICGSALTESDMMKLIQKKSKWIPQQHLIILPCAQNYVETRRAV